MSLPASVEGREQVRLFCALRLPETVVESLSKWQDEHIPDGRVVPRRNLHVTLAFLGHRPVHEVPLICAETREAAAQAGPIRFVAKRYRETPRVGMLALEELVVSNATTLAYDVQERMERLGIGLRERRPWKPHVTVVRFSKPLGLKPPLPELGEFAPSDAAAYLSQLGPKGAEYSVVDSFVLGGRE